MAKGDKESLTGRVELSIELTQVETQVSAELNRLESVMRDIGTTAKSTHARQPNYSSKKSLLLADTTQLDRFNEDDQVEILLSFENCNNLEVKRFVIDYLVKELCGHSSELGNDIHYAEQAAKERLTSSYENNIKQHELATRVRILFLEYVMTKCCDVLNTDTDLSRSATNYLHKAKLSVSTAQAFFNPPPTPKSRFTGAFSSCTIS